MPTHDYLHQVPVIRKGLKALLRDDRVFSTHDFDIDTFGWTYVGPGFDGLARIVVGQQVSTAAARSIWNKVSDGIAPTPRGFIKASEKDLRALGLSGAKVRTLKGLAEAVQSGRFDPAGMQDLTNDEVSTAITAMKGFGPWSAQMFLMFGLARPDIWAPGDLGIQYGLQYYLKAKERPDAIKAGKSEKRFVPHQTAASLLLWHLKTHTERVQKSSLK